MRILKSASPAPAVPPDAITRSPPAKPIWQCRHRRIDARRAAGRGPVAPSYMKSSTQAPHAFFMLSSSDHRKHFPISRARRWRHHLFTSIQRNSCRWYSRKTACQRMRHPETKSEPRPRLAHADSPAIRCDHRLGPPTLGALFQGPGPQCWKTSPRACPCPKPACRCNKLASLASDKFLENRPDVAKSLYEGLRQVAGIHS